MEAPGVGASNADNFTYQARAFLDQVSCVAEPLPACADALRTMGIIRAVVESSLGGGAAVTVPPAV
jgi:predicted dehydrogenase